jgi:hypothetical protein
VDFGVASTPPRSGSEAAGRAMEGRKKRGEKRRGIGASPRCGFRSSLHAQGRGVRRKGEAREEEQSRNMGLRLGVDFGVASTPQVGDRGGGRRGGKRRGRREEAWGFA